MKRNPVLTFRKPEALTRSAANVNSANLDDWFARFTQYLRDKNLLEFFQENPRNVVNLDETGFDLNKNPRKVATLKKIRHTYKKNSALHHENITATLAVSADGHVFTPQIIMHQGFSRMIDLAFASGGTIVNSIYFL